MKTSELKKIAEENGCNFMNSDNYYKIDGGAYIFAKVNKGNSEFLILHKLPKVIALAILDYAYTPLEEREEEKKYYLKFPKGYAGIPMYVRLNFGGYDRTYSSNDYHCTSSQTQFTQKEIDEMPFDTKFFEKVEVK